MPVDVPASWSNAPTDLDPPEYDAAELRSLDGLLVAGAGGGLDPKPGIVMHGQTTTLETTVDAADLVTVQPGGAIIDSTVGAFRVALPTAHSEQLTARHATWSRIDLVALRVLDPDVVGTHTERTGRLEILPGVPSSSPGVPALPTLAVEVARITVPPAGGGAATVDTTFREYACAVGGILPVSTESRLPTATANYQLARTLDTGVLYERVFGVWQPLIPDVPQLFGGTGTLNTGADGDANFAHGIGATPGGFVAVSTDRGRNCQVVTVDATNALIHAQQSDGSSFNGTFHFRWMAFL